MKKYLLTGIACSLLMVGTAAHAVSMNVQAGKHYTDVRAGLGDPNSGLSFNGGWARSDHDGQIGSLGTKFALPLGPFSASVGGKALYLSPKDGDDGAALAGGVGLNWDVLSSLNVYGEAYASPEGLTSGSKSYYEADVGAKYTVFKPLHVNAGYRVIEIDNAHNRSNNKLADGFYVGAGLSF
ncbi:YfaZ family outer membrane protein [Proteus myxofaciens]|uniref:YfaZ family protein n=1 Tax=Proteus myxofaciens ATCC 19692 TaxID=1354337 RepID=A0A198GEB1_9GAMM|nr:YfaZ family outer membrane protein [Proteus myxofaciens]OAT35782.1 YfaZ family protein [Proteus myxofaciens ATCC 19692]